MVLLRMNFVHAHVDLHRESWGLLDDRGYSRTRHFYAFSTNQTFIVRTLINNLIIGVTRGFKVGDKHWQKLQQTALLT